LNQLILGRFDKWLNYHARIEDLQIDKMGNKYCTGKERILLANLATATRRHDHERMRSVVIVSLWLSWFSLGTRKMVNIVVHLH